MAQTQFYRYISQGELNEIRNTKTIQSKSGVTYFTPDRYDNAQEARLKLALPFLPEYRIGPIPADEVPDFDSVPLGSVPYVDMERPGGGFEGATTMPLYLFGVYNLTQETYDTL